MLALHCMPPGTSSSDLDHTPQTRHSIRYLRSQHGHSMVTACPSTLLSLCGNFEALLEEKQIRKSVSLSFFKLFEDEIFASK